MSGAGNTACAGIGPTQGGMHPRAPDGSSLFYGRAKHDATHVWKRINGKDRLVSVNCNRAPSK